MPGGFHRTYGYDYIRVIKGEREARRVINETEASWVIRMFEWLVNEGLSTNQILFRLRENDAPTKSGKPWSRRSIQSILTNPAYTGKTYAFTTAPGKERFSRPQEEWIEIPDVTPPLISQELFNAAQYQLRVNRERSARNCRRDYLLRGHIRCRWCGRVYVGEYTYTRCYRCAGRKKAYAPVERCQNKGWKADVLENMVWTEIERYLSDRDLIESEIEKYRQSSNQKEMLEDELDHVNRQLKAANREQHRLLQWALKGFPESQVEAENKRLSQTKKTLETQKAELETRLKTSSNTAISVEDLEDYIRDIQHHLKELDNEGKRLALNMLGITIWLDGKTVEITGTLDPGIVLMSSEGRLPLL